MPGEDAKAMKAKQILMFATIMLAGFAFAHRVDNPGPKQVQLSEAVAMSYLIEAKAPQRPGDIENHIQGKVVLGITIDQEGKVTEAKVMSGHPLLASASIEAVKQWRFRPYLQDNAPVEVQTTATIEFVDDPPYVITPKPSSSLKAIRATAGVIDDRRPRPL